MSLSTSIGINRILLFFQAIKFQESVFALPFAYTGMFIAADGLPTASQFIWITIAMVMARTVGMTANRVIDKNIDALNPRTSSRHLPMGILKTPELIAPGIIALSIFIFASYKLNELALYLSPIAIIYLIVYPYTKRFTWAANIFLGWALAIAPAAAWIGVRGILDIEVVLLSGAVAFWAGSFDILYHTQDIEIQRNHKLNSVAARFGVSRAFTIAKILDALTVVTLVFLGIFMVLHLIYFLGCLIVAFFLVYKYILVKPNDLSKLGMAFMRINAFVSTCILIATILAIAIER